MHLEHKPQDKEYEVGGVFRCCIESLREADIPDDAMKGMVVPCLYAESNDVTMDHGMVWTGKVWRAVWITDKEVTR